MPDEQPVLIAPDGLDDVVGLRASLGGVAATTRPLQVAKPRLQAAERAIRDRFERDGRAIDVAVQRACLMDELIGGLWDWAQTQRYPLPNPTSAERLAVVAVGGYGRAELAPYSDVDLLFLYPYKPTPRIEQVVETIYLTLWDLHLTVGQAVRSVDEALRFARADTTILTAALETRLIAGDVQLYEHFRSRLRTEVLSARADTYIEQKLQERHDRQQQFGDSRYILEPNVKEGEGGMRDLQLILWLARYVYDVQRIDDLVGHNMLDRTELRTYRAAQRFLWVVRCHLHYLKGRAEDRLTFDLQTEVAERMGYRARDRLESVERFMKRFYMVAKDVSCLSSTVAGTLLDDLRRRRLRLPGLGRSRLVVDGFTIKDGLIDCDDPARFDEQPDDILTLFQLADAHDAKPRAQTLRAAKRALRGVNAGVRDTPETIARIVELITGGKRPARALEALNEIGALGRFVPEFGRVVALMEHNLYHAYTVDEHTICVIGQLDAIARGDLVHELPVATEAIKHIESKRELYLAAFFHDVGKGRKGNHATVGEHVTIRTLERWGLPAAQIETVAWLVRHHLLMTATAFSRDLEDPKTITDFVQVVQSPERLRLLLLLTVADIRGVSPTAWNGWKAQLLRALYRAAEATMMSGDVSQARRRQVVSAKRALGAALHQDPPGGWDEAAIDRYLRRHDPRYWLGCSTEDHVLHARLIAGCEADGRLSGLEIHTDAPSDRTEIVLYAPDHPGLFMEVTGALALAGASIVDAHIFTTNDSMVIDSFGVQDAASGGPVVDERRLNKIRTTVSDAIEGRIHLAKALAHRRPAPARTDVFHVTPRVLIDNGASRTHTVVELNGRDRPGLLFDITRTLKDLGLVVASAHVTTFGERAVDVVYLKDVFGMKITSPTKLERLRTMLLAALEMKPETASSP